MIFHTETVFNVSENLKNRRKSIRAWKFCNFKADYISETVISFGAE